MWFPSALATMAERSIFRSVRCIPIALYRKKNGHTALHRLCMLHGYFKVHNASWKAFSPAFGWPHCTNVDSPTVIRRRYRNSVDACWLLVRFSSQKKTTNQGGMVAFYQKLHTNHKREIKKNKFRLPHGTVKMTTTTLPSPLDRLSQR